MLALISLALSLGETLVSELTKSGVPAQVIASIQAAVNALAAHKNDLITKANLEAQRG